MDVQSVLKKDETGAGRPRVLVIDDEENVCELVSLYFEKAGYEVICTGDGSEGIEMVRTQKPDMVILDLMLPGMDGLDVCKEIRRSSNVPLIMLSARVDEVDRVLGLEIGADDYVTKPFSPSELLARVKAVLRRAAYVPSPDEQQVLEPAGTLGKQDFDEKSLLATESRSHSQGIRSALVPRFQSQSGLHTRAAPGAGLGLPGVLRGRENCRPAHQETSQKDRDQRQPLPDHHDLGSWLQVRDQRTSRRSLNISV